MTEGAGKHGAGEDNTPKREEETNRTKLQIEKLHNFYCSQYIIMRFNSRIDGACGMNSREGNFVQTFGRKTSRKSST
jgi:hypothetical protein